MDMIKPIKYFIIPSFFFLIFMAACNQPPKVKQKQTVKTDTTTAKPPTPKARQDYLTLPVLDALFFEHGFADSLKTQVGLTSAQIEKLKAAAHTSLRELTEDGATDTTSATEASQRYREQVSAIIGQDKIQGLQQLVNARYNQGVEGLAPSKPNSVPIDTRIVVNAPAFRMDIYQDGKLLKTYRVGIGYPEFPLPTGMRRADTLIFNPSWTPPDEPWVKGKFAPGRKVSGSDENNPLGAIKIPIGMPSLIHGGKPLTKIGNFASHGCVGLTNTQVKTFTAMLAQLGGSDLTAESITALVKAGKTKSINLKTPVPIDLRYETIVAENGSLHIYRDVYERGTNTLENAQTILQNYGIKYEQLSQPEKTTLEQAVDDMNRNGKGEPIAAGESKNGVAASKQAGAKKGKITPRVKGKKEIVVPIAALAGKGYPAPMALDSGTVIKK